MSIYDDDPARVAAAVPALVAVLADTSTDWIKGADGAVDASNANAANWCKSPLTGRRIRSPTKS